MNTLRWIKESFRSCNPNKAIAKRAIRHLKKIEKKQLFSDDISTMRAAEGRWYESLMYEMLLEFSCRSSNLQHIVRKGADAPFPSIPAKFGQNGLYFSNRGDINIRGNGQDIAEVDMLFVGGDGKIGFAEVVTSGTELKELREEVHYKKKLLGYLYGQITVPFVLFSSVDISRSSVVKKLMRETESVLIVTKSCDTLKHLLSSASTRGIPRKPLNHAKLIDVKDLQPRRPFDYKKIHDYRRDRVLSEITAGRPKEEFHEKDELPPVAKKLLLGALHESGSREIWDGKKLLIKGIAYDQEKIAKEFSKVIIALDIPEFEPVIYLRSRNKKEYLKVVVRKSGGFRVESKRTPQMTGFFLWLECLKPTIGGKVARNYADIFLTRA
ncbi:hypothetical protein L1S32_03165 [Methanogenium sp. S4BF]|uniref:hypothetical protein n=1 Tax=Methanogenium sp. S4BF TaxID=1789226 RepID=UPI002417AA8D|nr:hypothetical protein [Methanogenium sp. S4BF]WFN35132.1 hypothetical protein L1S32_03165 [Methanogenium sp. S4BF]